VSEHITRKELKQDRIKETFEHGAEAVFSHRSATLAVLLVILVVVSIWSGWRIYTDRQTVHASAAFSEAMKVYSARLGPADPSQPGEPAFADEVSRSNAAQQKFVQAADKYPRNYYGRLARYYSALCLEDADRLNQALEELKKISGSGDAGITALSQYQTAVIYARTGKVDEAAKIYRSLADAQSVLVPRPMVLLELANTLRPNNPAEAVKIYEQVKKEFPDTPIAEEADKGMSTISPKS
jgi:predicted negative regulator of RcsB-dependent stress response